MALQLQILTKDILLQASKTWLTGVCYASKKAGSSSKNPPGRPRGKHRGIKKDDGIWVSAGTLLVRQLGVLYFPGLNVGLGRNRDLFAMEHGHVYITTEKVNPNWDQDIMQRFFADYINKPDVPIYKTYLHVIPKPMPHTFKLVDEV